MQFTSMIFVCVSLFFSFPFPSLLRSRIHGIRLRFTSFTPLSPDVRNCVRAPIHVHGPNRASAVSDGFLAGRLVLVAIADVSVAISVGVSIGVGDGSGFDSRSELRVDLAPISRMKRSVNLGA